MAYGLPNGKFKTTKVTTFASYSENQKFEIDLITARNITFLKGHLELNYTTATSAPTAIEDGVAKLVQNLQLQYNGGAEKPVQALSLQQLVLYGKHIFNENLRNEQPPTATGESGTKYVDFIIIPSLNKDKDIQDPRYCIPGESPSINSMKIVGQWGNEANVWDGGANATINSANLVIDEEAGWTFGPNVTDLKNALGVDPEGYVYMPLWLTKTEQWTGQYTGLGLAISFPTDVIVRKIFLIAKDSNANRSDSVISELAIRTSDNDDLFGVLDWSEAQRISAWRLGITPVTGCLLIDCVDDVRDPGYASKRAGIEVKKTDKLYVRFSTSNAGSCDILFDCVRKVKVFE